MIWTVAKKELRGYFNSAVAVIFLAAFLGVTLYTFFWQEKFFARGLADLRPLFEWMPRLLIILVAALAMRLWADERRGGTLEVLLTLPVPRWRLVAGKFAAGMLLIAIALALTLGLPITIAKMGNLDTGPVIGGYLAALLLSAAYLSIGMCVSAATDNQIVAFVGTALLCGAAYAIGGDGTSALGRALGTGVRFESVARGVLDLRDLAYYGSIMVTGLALNVLLLSTRTWGRGKRARNRRIGMVLGVALIAANALALNLWLAPISRARIDLTEDRLYSLSSSTRGLLRSLDERLLIRGYFSEKMHPKLAPLVPQIRDLLEEYRIAGGDRVRVEIVDPSGSKEDKRDAKERFGVDAIQIPFASDEEKSLINAYFAVALEYGNQHEVLGIDDLIAVRSRDIGDVEVTVRNLEYQVTKSIKKVVTAFASLDSLFASAPGQIKMIAYLTPKTLPADLAAMPDKLKKVADELAKESKGKLAYTVVEPRYGTQLPPAEAQKAEEEALQIVQKHGARPRTAELFSDKVYYYNLVLEVGDRAVPVQLAAEDLGEAAIKSAITEALKRGLPGYRKVVGLWLPPPGQGQFMPEGMSPQQLPPPQSFQLLLRELSKSYELRGLKLDAPVPELVDVVVLAGPAAFDAKTAEHINQFVMRGGALVVLAGRFRPGQGRSFQLDPVTTGLEGLFEKWGIKVSDELVVDTKNESIGSPVSEDSEGPQEVEKGRHGLFVRITGDRLAGSSLITSGLPGAVIVFGSPVSAEPKVGDAERRVDVLLRSSSESWLTKSTTMLTDPDKYPGVGFPGPASEDQRGSQVLAVAITGSLPTGVARPGGDKAAGAVSPKLAERSPPDTRVVVFGSSSFASDEIVGLAQQLNSDLVVANLRLVQNAIDWALADTDLLAIRARTPEARAITIEPDRRDSWRSGNLVIAFLALGGVIGLAWFRRRAVKPYVTAKEV